MSSRLSNGPVCLLLQAVKSAGCAQDQRQGWGASGAAVSQAAPQPLTPPDLVWQQQSSASSAPPSDSATEKQRSEAATPRLGAHHLEQLNMLL